MVIAHPIPWSRVLDLPVPMGPFLPSLVPGLEEPPAHIGLEDEGRERRGKGRDPLHPRGSSICAFDINIQGSPQTNPGGPLQTQSVDPGLGSSRVMARV